MEEQKELTSKIIKLYVDEGKSINEISRILNKDHRNISKRLKDNGIKVNLSPQSKLNSVLDELAKDYKAGMTGPQLAVKYKVRVSSIYNALDKLKIVRREMTVAKRKYELDEHFFDEIDTEEKAYILGLLYADGYNNEKTHKIQLTLKTSDREILEKIRNIIIPGKPLTDHWKKDPLGNQAMRLVICNKHMSQMLAKHGCMQNKTFKITFPEWLEPDLIRHFVRGYFDGDGCITKCWARSKHSATWTAENWQVSILSTEMFCSRLKDMAMEDLEVNMYMHERWPERKTNNRTLSISGYLQLTRFLTWMYDDSTISLERKYKRYLSFLDRDNWHFTRENGYIQGYPVDGREVELKFSE